MLFHNGLIVHAQDMDQPAISYFHAHRHIFPIMQDTDFVENIAHAEQQLLSLLDSLEAYKDRDILHTLSQTFSQQETEIARQHGYSSIGELHEAFVMCMLYAMYQTADLDERQTVREMLDEIMREVTQMRPKSYPRLPLFMPGTDMVKFFCDHFTWLDMSAIGIV